MIDAFFHGLINVFTWPAFGFMLLGMSIGFVVGILPGIGGAVTLALMLGFIYDMDPVSAFSFLLGMNSVVATTGDITSVLFAIPGESTTAATILDGYPMTKKGQAGRALGAALMSSLMGAIIGAFALGLSVPIVKPLVLSFASPEFFALIILGITFIASLSGGSVIKALLAAALGFWLATIGLDGRTAILRYTFGQLYLWDGVGLVASVVGIFAIPEIMDLAVRRTAIAGEKVGKLGGVMEGVKDTFRHWFLVLRSSLIGTFVGVIPGLGGSVAQWVAYGHAVQSSPNKERFGKGAVEGVLAPGAANNSKEGGALIPTVAFGVPGSVAMAILLGAFLIMGLTPGPQMLTDKLDLTFSLMWIIVIANLICVPICFLFLRQLAQLTMIRGALLVPILLFLVFLGGYAAKNSVGDLVLVLIFGALGWAMLKSGWPRPPLILGLVLGALAEKNLYIASARWGAAFLARPIVIVIFILCLLSFLYPVYQARRARRRREAKA